jgi:predicted DNA-binding protein with PD1-like motif
MHSIVPATVGKVVFIHMEPQEDVLESLMTTIEREQLKSGLILTITGALSEGRLSAPVRPEAVQESPGFIEFSGLSEVQGGGYFGWNVDDWRNDKSQIRFDKGRPHIHCHMSVSNGGKAFVGHLIEGCKVRSVYPVSHFVAVLAETPGVDLTLHCSKETSEQYPHGIPYYGVEASARSDISIG